MNRNRALDPIARTKVRPPLVHPGLIERTRLMRAFAGHHNPALTVVAGPSGSGKTTAVLQFLEITGGESAWVSLDHDDDDPRLFWRLVVAALTETTSSRIEEATALASEPGADIAWETVPTLINELLDLEQNVTLVIDDFHVVNSDHISAQLSTFVERRPPLLRIVLTTRHAPSLPLAKWRARRELVEIGVDLLNLDETETRDLVQRVRPGTEEELSFRLARETEGWVAGVHLAAGALGSHEGGTSVTDFVMQDVLAHEPVDTVEFLHQVSVLDELTASACDAVTKRSDSVAVIADIERRSLFLSRLDTPEPTWRLHGLFRDALRTGLEAQQSPEEVAVLHRRAGQWASDRGDWKTGVRHIHAAGEPHAAADLLERWWLHALNNGEFEHFEREIQKLPEQLVDNSPDLVMAKAFTALNLGQLEGAHRHATRLDEIATAEMEGGAALVHTHYHRHVGDVPQAANHAARALRTMSTGDTAGQAAASSAYGECLYWLDDQECLDHLARAIDLGRRSGEHMSEIAGHVFRAAWFADEGDNDGATSHVEDARALARDQELDRRHHLAMASIALSQVEAQEGDRAAAELALENGITMARHGRERLAQLAGWVHLAHLRHRAGDSDGATRALTEAGTIHRLCVSPGRLTDQLERVKAALAAPSTATGTTQLVEPLTDRERAMLRMLRSELTQREIANHMFISFNTARTHTKAIYRKLGVSSRAEAVAVALGNGLLDSSGPNPRLRD